MVETISIQDVTKMLDIAKFHLQRFKSEHLKATGRDTFAMEAYMLACLQVGSSVFYTLTNPDKDVTNPFLAKARDWKIDLRNGRKTDYDFFFRMLDHHRGSAVHIASMPSTVGESAIASHIHPGMSGWGVGGEIGVTFIEKLRIDDVDAIALCEKFLALLGELVRYCNAPLEK